MASHFRLGKVNTRDDESKYCPLLPHDNFLNLHSPFLLLMARMIPLRSNSCKSGNTKGCLQRKAQWLQCACRRACDGEN